MTYEEIEGYRKRLQELIEKWRPTETPESAEVTKGDFYKLARQVERVYAGNPSYRSWSAERLRRVDKRRCFQHSPSPATGIHD